MSDIKKQYSRLSVETKSKFEKSILKYTPGTYVYYYDLDNVGQRHACIKYGKIGHGFQILGGHNKQNSEGQSRQIRLEIEGEKGTRALFDIYSTREEALIAALESSNYEMSEYQTGILISES